MATDGTSISLTPIERGDANPSIHHTETDETSTPSVYVDISAEEEPATPPSPSPPPAESTTITEVDPNAFKVIILLASSGYRTQISINRSLLEKESSVDREGFLVSQLKYVLWKDWPSDWSEAHPQNPNYLRLIYGGKMLADKSTLSECGIGPNKPNILHVSIRPADLGDDEFESGKKIPGIPRRSSGNGCCNCVIS